MSAPGRKPYRKQFHVLRKSRAALECFEHNYNMMLTAQNQCDDYKVLHQKLLSIGGAVVCQTPDEHLYMLIGRGQAWTPKQKEIELKLGRPSGCHSNSAYLWSANSGMIHLVTGYGLSRDGIWRQHTWCMRKDQSIIETTEKRIAYFGFILNQREAKIFSSNNGVW